MSKKKTRKRNNNNRYSRKRVSRKRVSRKKNKRTGRKIFKRKMMRGGMDASESDVARAIKDEKAEHIEKVSYLTNLTRISEEEAIDLLQKRGWSLPQAIELHFERSREEEAGGAATGAAAGAAVAAPAEKQESYEDSLNREIMEKEDTVKLLKGMGEQTVIVESEIDELNRRLESLKGQRGAPVARRDAQPVAQEPALEPAQLADFGGLADGPDPDDDLKFVLIPGFNNAWGDQRHTKEEGERRNLNFNPAHYQSKIAELIGDNNILKSTASYNERGVEFHCGHRQNKPFRVQWEDLKGNGRHGDTEMRNCIQNIFETYPKTPKSVISTSQGSAVFIDYMADNPGMLDNIRSIVFVSPATTFHRGPKWPAPWHKLNNFLKKCKDKNIGILLLLNDNGWARWDNKKNECCGEKKGAGKTSDCSTIKKYMQSSDGDLAIQIPRTTHSFDILKDDGTLEALSDEFVQAIKTWCENPSLETAQEISKYGTTVNL
jgi:hypothetical protein